MKRTLRFIALLTIAATLICALLACSGKLSGKYEADVGEGTIFDSKVTYEFSGDSVTMTVTKDGLFGGETTTTYTGTYVIEDDKITFELEDYIKESVTYSFSEGKVDGEKVIIIDERIYKKVD